MGVDQEIERALQAKVMLPHGGHLVIETTEALTTIDVNSGKFTGASSLEKTVLRTNLDACWEIARQLRLRDIGGIIVIDFIDMDRSRHRKQVTAALREAFADDRMRTRIMHITRLGLVEMTRKRTGENLADKLQAPCPCCEGTGAILAPETIALRASNEIRSRVYRDPQQAVHVVADPLCTLALIGPHGSEAEALEEELGVPVYARATYAIHPESYELSLGDKGAFRQQYGRFQRGQVVTIEPRDMLRGRHSAFLALVEGCVLEVPELSPDRDEPIKVRITKVQSSYLRATPA
jgi:ribonuclease G